MLDIQSMELEQVKGNTWVIKSWVMIPLYKVDDHRCILLDSGIRDQESQLEELLTREGLTCVGVLGSHAHVDHMGNHAYLQRKHGAKIAMSLGEAGVLSSKLGMNAQSYNLSPRQITQDTRLTGTECVADIIIMPQDAQVTIDGVTFDVIHTPGHTVDHVAYRTPDNVLYLGDAIMTGRTLFQSKFPYVLSMQGYFDSLRVLRDEAADFFIAAHWGVYPEILSFIDMEARFLVQRMQEILDLIEDVIAVEQLTSAICHAYGVTAHTITDLSYFERVTRAFLYYLMDRGHIEAFMEDNVILFRRLIPKIPPENMQTTPPKRPLLFQGKID